MTQKIIKYNKNYGCNHIIIKGLHKTIVYLAEGI